MATRARLGLLASVAVALLLGACGKDAPRSSSLVDDNRRAPVNGFAIDESSGEILLATNRGLFRISGDEAERIHSTVATPDGTGPVGTFLAFTRTGPGELLGSGHPDEKGRIAPFLGLIRSGDGGRHWRTVSRYGFADLHTLRRAHGRLYAYDAVLGGMLVSEDGGRNWEESFTPSGLALDFVVDPADGDQLLLSYEQRIVSSSDRGRSWQPLVGADRARLAWPAEDVLYRADQSGEVFESGDGGASWSLVGILDGEPWKLMSIDSDHLYAVLRDASVMESTDGGRNWEAVFTP